MDLFPAVQAREEVLAAVADPLDGSIDRSRGANVVRTFIEEFARRQRMSITITPEGTRSRVAEWKLGFLHIANEADVPIVPVALDYSRKLVHIMPAVMPTGDANADLQKIKALYHSDMARYPGSF